MSINYERQSRVQEALREAKLAAVVCSLPSDVLLLTGYWPVVGTSIAICVCDGPTVLLVPEDEDELAQGGFADSIKTFVPETLKETRTISEAIKPHLANILNELRLGNGSVGVETGASSEAASYLAVHLYGNSLPNMIAELVPAAKLVPAENWIRDLKSVKTPHELEKIRQACRIARSAYQLAAPQIRAGMNEQEVAELFRAPLSETEFFSSSIQRCDGFAFCMSGPNSARAYAAYARTRSRALERNDLVMIHCNSYVDGFWTDITRTYTLETPDERQCKIRAAVLAAREAALACIKPGVPAQEVDSAARQVIHECGLGEYLKHGTGHGVGFSPMSAYSVPSIHSGSTVKLQEGMVFNVEPAIYIEGYGGVRHCDMVGVTRSGYELLTDFQSDGESAGARSYAPAQHESVRASSGASDAAHHNFIDG
jgi:Xaa-Pro dipeptidase